MKQKVPESGVLRACLDLLAYEHIWHERRNNVPVMVPNGRGGKRPVKVAANGTADIMATPVVKTVAFSTDVMTRDSLTVTRPPQPIREVIVSQMILWIECKSDSGKQREAQIEFEREVTAAGHHYLLVRDVDTLRDWLRARGVIR